MRVILKNTGRVQDVADGYARNFLLPKGLAIIATDLELKKIDEKRKSESEEERKKREFAVLTAKKLDGKLVTVSKKTGPDGKLFGSVTAREICESISSQFGIIIDKHNIILKKPIKNIGQYEVIIDLGGLVKCQINLKILS